MTDVVEYVQRGANPSDPNSWQLRLVEIGGVKHLAVVLRGSDGAAVDAADLTAIKTAVQIMDDWDDTDRAKTVGPSFNVTVTPTVTNGGYSANDLIGGIIEVAAGRVANGKVILQDIEFVTKAAVTPTLTCILLNAAPATPGNYDDNDAYSLDVADAFKFQGTVTGFSLIDHGTPNTYEAHNLARVVLTDANSKFYALFKDAAGVTLTSTSDVQVRFAGEQY